MLTKIEKSEDPWGLPSPSGLGDWYVSTISTCTTYIGSLHPSSPFLCQWVLTFGLCSTSNLQEPHIFGRLSLSLNAQADLKHAMPLWYTFFTVECSSICRAFRPITGDLRYTHAWTTWFIFYVMSSLQIPIPRSDFERLSLQFHCSAASSTINRYWITILYFWKKTGSSIVRITQKPS